MADPASIGSSLHDPPFAPAVVYLGRNLYVGGAERVMVHYLNEARRLRPIGVLLDARGPLLREVKADVPLYDLSNRPSAVPHTVRRSARAPGTDSVEKWKILREAWRLRGIIRGTGARLVSSFLMRSHMVAVLARDLWCPDVRLVFNIHSMIIQSERLLYPHPVSRRIMRAFLRRGFPRADRIVAVADAVAAELREHVSLPADRLTVAHNPIDVEAIRRGAGDGPALPGLVGPVVVAVGRLVHLKGFDLLLDAVARIDPKARPTVVIVGDGPEREALAAQAEGLGLSSRVHMVGHRSNPWSYVTQASALVVPSRTEAVPNVIGEALVLGVPVVATDCTPGVREYLQDGACGILVPPDDPGALALALEGILGDRDLRSRLGAAGRAQADRFTMAAMVHRYESVLLETLDG